MKATPAQLRYLRKAKERCEASGSRGVFLAHEFARLDTASVCARSGWISEGAFYETRTITPLGLSVLAEHEGASHAGQ